jgi:hypothetical protein
MFYSLKPISLCCATAAPSTDGRHGGKRSQQKQTKGQRKWTRMMS